MWTVSKVKQTVGPDAEKEEVVTQPYDNVLLQ